MWGAPDSLRPKGAQLVYERVGVSLEDGIWKFREICHFGLYYDLKGLQKDFMAVTKSRKFSGFMIYSHLKNSAFTAVENVIYIVSTLEESAK